MRKRQKPYILIMVLVICGGLVAFMNTPPSKGSQRPPEPPPTDGKADVKVPDKSQVAGSVGAKMKKLHHAPIEPDSGPDSTGPVILKPKIQNYEPKPNESQTASGWYRDDAAKSYSGSK